MALTVNVTNGPPGSGKDAISSTIKQKLSDSGVNVVQLSFKSVLFDYTARAFNMDKMEFYNDTGDGMYNRENKELPNENFKVSSLYKTIARLDSDGFYQKANKEVGSNVEYSSVDELNEIVKDGLEKFSLKYNFNGDIDDMSPRQALIFTSEYIIKPEYGSDFFGKAMASQLKYVEKEFSGKDVQVFITDSGFIDELKPISNFNLNILSIYRDGTDYDPSKDSRTRITQEQLDNAGMSNVEIIKVENNKTLNEISSDVIDYILPEFNNKIKKPNVAVLQFSSGAPNESKFLQIMRLMDHNLKYPIKEVSFSGSVFEVSISRDDGAEFTQKDNDIISQLSERYKDGFGLIKRGVLMKIDNTLEPKTNISDGLEGNLKNLIEIKKRLDLNFDAKLYNSISHFLEYKPKNNEVFRAYSLMSLEQLNYSESLNSKVADLKSHKSLKTLFENIIEKTNVLESSLENKSVYLKVNSNKIEDGFKILDTIKYLNKFSFDIQVKSENLIKAVDGGFEINVSNINKHNIDNVILSNPICKRVHKSSPEISSSIGLNNTKLITLLHKLRNNQADNIVEVSSRHNLINLVERCKSTPVVSNLYLLKNEYDLLTNILSNQKKNNVKLNLSDELMLLNDIIEGVIDNNIKQIDKEKIINKPKLLNEHNINKLNEEIVMWVNIW